GGSVRAVPHAAGVPGPHAARPLRHGGRVQAFRLYAPTERGTADDVRQLDCGLWIADCGFELPLSSPQSPIRTPQFLECAPPTSLTISPPPSSPKTRFPPGRRAGSRSWTAPPERSATGGSA